MLQVVGNTQNSSRNELLIPAMLPNVKFKKAEKIKKDITAPYAHYSRSEISK
jgi:hypothetical protein